ncbi:hypothetical protein G6F22_019468 [Rhizopus arrhizus]|nr:hypothetical protein G6F22_019468 [Rhizopus arrhizus]
MTARAHRTAPLDHLRAGAAHPDQVHAQPLQLLLHLAVGALLVGPALGEHTVDPTLQQRGERPPVQRVDQYQRVGRIQPRLLGGDIGRRSAGAAEQRLVLQAEARIEALGHQIGVGHAVAGIGCADGLADAPGDGVGQRGRIRMGDDNEAPH